MDVTLQKNEIIFKSPTLLKIQLNWHLPYLGEKDVLIYSKYFFHTMKLFFVHFRLHYSKGLYDYPTLNGNKILFILQDRVERTQNIAGHLHFS